MSVGDVKSNERGSGARFNDGKAPFDLMPLRLLHNYHARYSAMYTPDKCKALGCLYRLALWQESGEVDYLYDAMEVLGSDFAEAMHVLDYGRRKYAAWNWAKGMQWSVCLGCAVRHILSILRGEKVDPESGRNHAGHVMCNIIFLLTFIRSYPEGDDRPRVFEVAA